MFIAQHCSGDASIHSRDSSEQSISLNPLAASIDMIFAAKLYCEAGNLIPSWTADWNCNAIKETTATLDVT